MQRHKFSTCSSIATFLSSRPTHHPLTQAVSHRLRPLTVCALSAAIFRDVSSSLCGLSHSYLICLPSPPWATRRHSTLVTGSFAVDPLVRNVEGISP